MAHTASRRIGDIDVTVLTDGVGRLPPALFPGTEEGRILGLLDAAGETEVRTNFNALLVRSGGRTVLVDAGAGQLMGPACGHLAEALAEAGAAPDEIDVFFVTHFHPDHVGGALAPDGGPAFPNAELVVAAKDRDFWLGDLPADTDLIRNTRTLARNVAAAYGERVRVLDGAETVSPGLTALPLPGHTPGHSGLRIGAGREQLIHVGDIVHALHVQIADPDIAIAFDIDPDAARASRKRLLDEVATDGVLVTGGHLLQPAFCRIERSGGGYRMVRD